MLKFFKGSIFVTIIGLLISMMWGGAAGAATAAILAVLEISLSFDNAVINAKTLATMDEKWRHRFITWGMFIAVFVMRFIFPIAIVAIFTGLGMFEVAKMAVVNPTEYSHHLHESHIQVDMFGGAFLMLVFLSFILDDNKDVHWIEWMERHLAAAGGIRAIEVAITLLAMTIVSFQLPVEHRAEGLIAGLSGTMIFIVIGGLANMMEVEGDAVQRSGAMSFMYLEVLDASFSLDGVIGAFALTNDVVLILCGLTIGAMFVRSLTIMLVEKGTLSEYRYLEHGAHYAIGALAAIMMIKSFHEVPEAITGLIGAVFITASLVSSIKYNRSEAAH
jgi:hypothetical protein